MILFVSCDKDDESPNAEVTSASDQTESGTETTTEATDETEQPQEPTPENESVDYASIISKWNQYIEYKNSDEIPQYELEALFNSKSNDNTAVNVSMYHRYLAVVRTTYSQYNDLDQVFSRSYKYEIYNFAEARKILTFSTPSFNPNDDEAAFRTPSVAYTVNFVCDAYGEFTGIINVVTSKLVNTQEDPELEPVYERVYTYAYYDTNGEALASQLEEPATVTSLYDDNTTLITFDGRCYVSRDGEIIFTCNKGEERAIPYFDSEYNGFKYVLTNEKVIIYDAEYNRVANYSVNYNSDVDSQKLVVLANGDVLVEQIVECGYNESNFDYEYDFSKYKVNHVVISASTGKATEIELDFVIDVFVGKMTDAVNGVSVRADNYQYAEVRRFADGKISSNVEFLILDNALNEVENLPKIVKNQTSIYEFVDADYMIVKATNPTGSNLYYMVNMSNKSVRPYYDIENDSAYQSMNGGYIYNDILYNNDGNQLYDLRHVISYSIDNNGESLRVEQQYGLDGDELAYDESGMPIYPASGIVRMTIMSIDDTNDLYMQSTVAYKNDLHMDRGFYYSDAEAYTVWDKYGNEIICANNVSLTMLADDCYLLTVRKTVTEYDDRLGIYREVTYTEYNIMK